MSNLDEALRQFEAVEANLSKLEKSWKILEENVPKEIIMGVIPGYEDACYSYEHLLVGLPLVDVWRPTTLPCEPHEIAQFRLDFLDSGEISIEIEMLRRIKQPGKELREYRFRFDRKRRQLVQNIIFQIFNEIDRLLNQLQEIFPIDEARIQYSKKIDNSIWLELRDKVRQIDILLGSSILRPSGWNDMQRHLRYAESHDLRDIICTDWPLVKAELTKSLYTSNEPIPVLIDDLSNLVASKPSGSILTKLKWDKLSADDFERLVFNLLTSDQSYENPQWLMHLNAPDGGRDLSVFRVYRDGLSNVVRRRVIIQCKHWLSKSISLRDVSELKDQVKSWEPPRIDVLVIATTGRFTAKAVHSIERHNQSDSAMTIEMWADSHFERILALNPALVAEFGLR